MNPLVKLGELTIGFFEKHVTEDRILALLGIATISLGVVVVVLVMEVLR